MKDNKEYLTEDEITEAHRLMCAERWTYTEIEKKFGATKRTLQRYFAKRNLKVIYLPKC